MGQYSPPAAQRHASGALRRTGNLPFPTHFKLHIDRLEKTEWTDLVWGVPKPHPHEPVCTKPRPTRPPSVRPGSAPRHTSPASTVRLRSNNTTLNTPIHMQRRAKPQRRKTAMQNYTLRPPPPPPKADTYPEPHAGEETTAHDATRSR